MGISICTAADDIFIKEVFMLLYSIKRNGISLPIYLYDLGLSEDNIRLIKNIKMDIQIVPISSFEKSCLTLDEKFFKKPFFVRGTLDKTNDHVLWIDVDTLMFSKFMIDVFFSIGMKESVFTKNSLEQIGLDFYFNDEVRKKYIIPYLNEYETIDKINNGVFIFNKNDGKDLLDKWCELSEDMFVKENVRFRDQGCLIMALCFFYPHFKILGKEFNFNFLGEFSYTKHAKYIRQCKSMDELWNLFEKMLKKSIAFIHFNGTIKLNKIVKFSTNDVIQSINKL